MKTNFLILLCIVFLASCSQDNFEEISKVTEKKNKSGYDVTIEEAKTLALNFIKNRQSNLRSTGSASGNITQESVISVNNDSTMFYSFNFDKGFVLVSGNKKFHPVLAYSDEGHFDIDEARSA